MRTGILILAALIAAALAAFFVSSRFLVDLLWFRSLGFEAVFMTSWLTLVAVFTAATALSFLILFTNGLIAVRASAAATGRWRTFRVVGRNAQGLPEILELSLERLPWRLIIAAASLIIGVFVGMAQVSNWDLFLKWFYAVPFGRADPLFDRDLGFYVFSVPVYELVRDWALLIIFLSAAGAVAIYLLRGGIDYQYGGRPAFSAAALRHLSALLAIFFLVKAGGYLLDRYDLLTSNNGIVFGAAYTDVHLRLPLLVVLAGASLIAAALCAYNIWQMDFRLPIAAAILVFGLSLLQTIVPGVVQSYWVKPDELKLESRYIARNIEFTRYGFGLNDITSARFPATGKLTRDVIARKVALDRRAHGPSGPHREEHTEAEPQRRELQRPARHLRLQLRVGASPAVVLQAMVIRGVLAHRHAITDGVENARRLGVGFSAYFLHPPIGVRADLAQLLFHLPQDLGAPALALRTEPAKRVNTIEPGVNGLLADSEHEWTDRIVELLTDEGEQKRMGMRARRDALLSLSPWRQAHRYLALLHRAAGSVRAGIRPELVSPAPIEVKDEPVRPEPVEPFDLSLVLAEIEPAVPISIPRTGHRWRAGKSVGRMRRVDVLVATYGQVGSPLEIRVFEPGTRWHYSDAGPNWLAECLTLAYRRGMRERIADDLRHAHRCSALTSSSSSSFSHAASTSLKTVSNPSSPP